MKNQIKIANLSKNSFLAQINLEEAVNVTGGTGDFSPSDFNNNVPGGFSTFTNYYAAQSNLNQYGYTYYPEYGEIQGSNLLGLIYFESYNYYGYLP